VSFRIAGTYNEDDMEHYAGLIDVVASLNDERSIPALVGAVSFFNKSLALGCSSFWGEAAINLQSLNVDFGVLPRS
jgi:hypothetical protein